MKFKIKTDDDDVREITISLKLVDSDEDGQINLVAFDEDGTDYALGYFDSEGLHLWVEDRLEGLPIDRNGYLKIERIK